MDLKQFVRALTVAVAASFALGCTVKPYMVEGQEFQPRGLLTGTIYTDAMVKAPPLNERGASRIGVVTTESSEIWRTHVGITIFGNSMEKYEFSSCLAPDRLAVAFVDGINAHEGFSAVNLRDEAAAIIPQIKQSYWDGSENFVDTPEATALRERLQEQYGIDAVLLITEEVPTSDFLVETTAPIGPKGLYTGPRKLDAAHAAFSVTAINLETGKQVPNTNYSQGSYWQMPAIDREVAWEALSQQVKDDLCRRLKVLDRNNVAQALWLLKVDPAEAPWGPTADSAQ